MSVITVLPALPGRLRLLFAAVAEEGPIARSKLEKLTLHAARGKRGGALDGEGGGSTLFAASLNEAIKLDLIREEDDQLQLGAALPKNADVAMAFLTRVEKRLLSPQDVGSDDIELASALAWFLTRSVAPGLAFGEDSRRQIAKDLDLEDGQAPWGVTNDSRFQNLIYWARFLGLATGLDLGKGKAVVPDPTAAIRRHLNHVLPAAQAIPIETFQRSLALHLPVLEFGTIREAVEARLREQARRPENVVSESTSLALRRLRRAGAIRLEARSDAAVMLVDGERFSHIERTETKSDA